MIKDIMLVFGPLLGILLGDFLARSKELILLSHKIRDRVFSIADGRKM